MVDRENFEAEIDDRRQDKPRPRRPTPHQANRQARIARLVEEMTVRLRDARRALLNGEGARAEDICATMRSYDGLGDILKVPRSTIHRWEDAEVSGMDRIRVLRQVAADLTALRGWTG